MIEEKFKKGGIVESLDDLKKIQIVGIPLLAAVLKIYEYKLILEATQKISNKRNTPCIFSSGELLVPLNTFKETIFNLNPDKKCYHAKNTRSFKSFLKTRFKK